MANEKAVADLPENLNCTLVTSIYFSYSNISPYKVKTCITG